MEATIAEDEPVPVEDSGFLHEIADPRMVRAALSRAAGASWKSIAAELGVSEGTIYLWRRQAPIDALALQVAREGVSQGALKLMGSFSRAVDVITGIMDDESAKPSDRLNAASQVVRNVVKVASVQHTERAEPKDPLDDVGDHELVEFIRATRKLGSGQGGR